MRMSAGARFTVTVGRKIEAAIAKGGLDAFAALFHRDIRQAHHCEVAPIGRADVYLGLNQVRIDSENRRAERFVEHGPV